MASQGNIIYQCSMALDNLIQKFRPSRNTNRCFHSIFYERESTALAGHKFSKFLWLFAVYLFTLFAIAYALRSQSNLQEKMKDPFVLGVTADIPSSAEPGMLEPYLDVENNPDAAALADKYHYRNIYQYYKFANFFSNADEESGYFRGRSINFDDPMMANILAKDNLLVGHGFDTLNQLSIYPENQYSVIVTQEMYNDLYPSDNEFEFPYLDLAHFDSTGYQAELFGDEYLYKKDRFQQEYFSEKFAFPFLIEPNDKILIPISAVVKKLPDGRDFLTTQGYYQNFMNNEPSLTQKYDNVVTLSFLMQLDEKLMPVKTLTPEASGGVVNNVFPQVFLEDLQVRIAAALSQVESCDDIYSYVKDMFMHQSYGEDKIQLTVSEYVMSFRPMVYVSVRLSDPVYFDEMQAFVQEWEKSETFKSSDLFEDVVDVIPFYDPNINTSESYYVPEYTSVGINFNDLREIDEFTQFFEDKTMVELEMSRVESLKNYKAVTRLVIFLIFGLVLISTLFIYSLLDNTVRDHLLKSRRNLGTFMAMGINMKSLYMLVMFTYIVLAGVLGLFGVTVIYFALLAVADVKVVLIDYRLLLLFITSLLFGFSAAIVLINRFFNKPPGDLIYGDDDSVLHRDKRVSTRLLNYTRKEKD
ncbi:MAG: hypothetical protein C0593_11765 [Marinilabiliales bacterium]|nr:MAG: hypothetical protein C0593_11765 [Marinilabiliales bacterium]